MCAIPLKVSKSPIIFLLLILNSMYEIVTDAAGATATGKCAAVSSYRGSCLLLSESIT